MARIVFVNPMVTKEQRYGDLATGGSYMPPLGLAHLASQALAHGHEAFILDCEALGLGPREATRHILAHTPTVVGFTATTVTIYNAAAHADMLKEQAPDVTALIGGAQISALPQETMARFPSFDIGIVGEGELTIVELLEALDTGKPLDPINGLVLRTDDGLALTEPRAFMRDLDVLPKPAWHLLPDLVDSYAPSVFGFKQLPASSLVTSRGCPGECTFCNQGPWGNRYRTHSPEYVMDMLRTLYYDYGIRDIAFYDGTFGIKKKRLRALCEMLVDEQWDLTWSANARIDTAHPDLFPLMRKAGCWSLAFGIESGSRTVLDFIKKGTTPDKSLEILGLARRAGIVTKGYIMLGTLVETRQTMQETLDFVMKADLDLLTVNHFSPFPGTLDYERAPHYGDFANDWRTLNEHNLVFVPHGCTGDDIEEYIRTITRRFYMRPHVIKHALQLALVPRNVPLLWEGFKAFMRFVTSRH